MFYLKSKKLDISFGQKRVVFINSKTAIDEGITAGMRLEAVSPVNHSRHIVHVEISDKLVEPLEVGVDEVLWEEFELENNDLLALDWMPRPKSLEAIRKKLLGGTLKESEIRSVIEDIVNGYLGDIEATYFAACGFNPGFTDNELYYLTKSMADSGVKLKWPYEKVVDKHSIGGLAGKGITPIIVSIISSLGLVIPNTSTRAITAPAGTTDVMEAFCHMEFTTSEIEDLVRKNNACIVWGGGLDLAPADEALIEIEKPLGIELYDKFIVSILAKKVAMGLTHFVLDLPYGPDTKVENPDDVPFIQYKFETIAAKFGIRIKVCTRQALGPDGRGIGPNLEAIDTLKVLMQDDDRYLPLEYTALTLAGELLELAEEAKPGKGYEIARKELVSGRAYKQFKKLIQAQGGNPDIRPNDIPLGDIRYDVVAWKDGMVKDIQNVLVKEVSHALGTPSIRQAGIYLHKQIGENVTKGEVLYTLYTTSKSRLELAQQILGMDQIVIY
ncbi:MAG: putative thymidine phosphorylase [Candidatus Dojkabacteria bacterium]|nr:MAG: putative thymidine phosphorylase [Candidatus Dojkabacteria bacterium]GIW57088.1 MAG: putative thymidine phosphorylase [Candidatus Dojkabacteria bacterium]